MLGFFHFEFGTYLATRAILSDDDTVELEGGTIDLFDGEVSFNMCGANVQTLDVGLDQLQDHVWYRNNGQDLDMSALPVPEPPDLASVPSVP